MKSKLSTTIILVLLATAICAQSKVKISEKEVINTKIIESNIYQIFPTQNIWTFIKLDSRNGKMWQIQFDVNGGNRGETPLNLLPLISEENEVKGRFTLYPTQNIYNFILLDQIDGKVYQVQWSMKEENRGVILIN
jgi:hypothetical protein